MKSVQCERPEDRLADVLAAYADVLATGRKSPPRELDEAVEPALRAEWTRLTSFLALLEQAWPRASGDKLELENSNPENTSRDALARCPAHEGRFGRFQIQHALGQGGFGIVFRAWDPDLERNVALKVPQPESVLSAEAHRRFLQEARAAAGLDHPNIVPVYEIGSVGSVSYIASAFCPGPTLAGWFECQSGFVPERDAASLVATLALAVQHAHERGVLHRDLKPGNILLQPAQDEVLAGVDHLALVDFQPRITDFSLANVAGATILDSRTASPFGSPPYMAPEQAQGRLAAIGPPTDVYALGCILYELLTGKPPFRGRGQLDTLRQVIAEQPIPPRRWRRELSAPLQAIVMKCLEKDPGDRYVTARDLSADLQRFLVGEPMHGLPSGRWQSIRRTIRRHSAALVFVVTTALWCAALLGQSIWFEARLERNRQTTQPSRELARRRDADTRPAGEEPLSAPPQEANESGRGH
jgi:serine/threonine protein kinase